VATTEVEVVSPSKVLYSGEAAMVVCRTVAGEIAFLANHIPFLGTVEPCVARLVAEDNSQVQIAVGGGFVEVRDNKVILLADSAEMGDDVDVEAARSALRDAEARLAEDAEDHAAAAAVRAAEARLEAAGAGRGD
jgi:F-type H+-transporting ATPase subunit epsilon